MLKMVIQMDTDKIISEKKYQLESLYQTIETLFHKLGLPKAGDTDGVLVYEDTGSEQDYGRFGRAVNTLKKQSWFMDNVSAWMLYDSDESDNPNDFSEEDLLSHYRLKQALGV